MVKTRKSAKRKVRVVRDGEYLYDASGRKIMRYKREAGGYAPLNIIMPHDTCIVGWKCHKECVLYDKDMKCIQWIQTCDPVFGPCPDR